MTGPEHFTISEVAVDFTRANGAAAQTAAIQLHALTYNWTRVMQLANTPPLQSTTPDTLPRKHSPDVATPARKQTSDYSLLLNLSTSKGWKAELA